MENCWTCPVARGEGIDANTATEELFKKFQVNERMKNEQYTIHVTLIKLVLTSLCTCTLLSSSPLLPLPVLPLPRAF